MQASVVYTWRRFIFVSVRVCVCVTLVSASLCGDHVEVGVGSLLPPSHGSPGVELEPPFYVMKHLSDS